MWRRGPPCMPWCRGAGSPRGPSLQHHPEAEGLTACVLKTSALRRLGGSELVPGPEGGVGGNTYF